MHPGKRGQPVRPERVGIEVAGRCQIDAVRHQVVPVEARFRRLGHVRVLLLDRDVDGPQPELAEQLSSASARSEVDPGVPHEQVEGWRYQIRGDAGITPDLDGARHFVTGEGDRRLGLLDGVEHPAGVVHQDLPGGGERNAALPFQQLDTGLLLEGGELLRDRRMGYRRGRRRRRRWCPVRPPPTGLSLLGSIIVKNSNALDRNITGRDVFLPARWMERERDVRCCVRPYGTEVLLDLNDVVSLEAADDGFRLRYRCLCGDMASTCLSVAIALLPERLSHSMRRFDGCTRGGSPGILGYIGGRGRRRSHAPRPSPSTPGADRSAPGRRRFRQ